MIVLILYVMRYYTNEFELYESAQFSGMNFRPIR